jgi:hypothetical protein
VWQFYNNKLIILAKFFDKEPLIIILIREIYTQKFLVYPGVTKTKKFTQVFPLLEKLKQEYRIIYCKLLYL